MTFTDCELELGPVEIVSVVPSTKGNFPFHRHNHVSLAEGKSWSRCEILWDTVCLYVPWYDHMILVVSSLGLGANPDFPEVMPSRKETEHQS